MRTNNVEHIFPLSGDNNYIQANGIDSIMSFYQNSLNNVELSGPTYFAPIIDAAMKSSYSTISNT